MNDFKLPHRAWLVVALLVPVALLNYLDRQMLAAMKFSVMQEIPGIEHEANWGKILAYFKWTYAILSPIGGYIADRFSRRHVIAGSLFAWSFITWATGHVTTYEQLLWTRAIMGISEAFYIPAALALIADFHRGSTRSKAVGFHQMGIYVGVIIGGFSGYVADNPDLGWRWAFDACGIIGLLYAVPLFFLLRNAPRSAAEDLVPRTSPLGALKELLGNRSFILLVLYFTLPALAGWVVRDWMPAILKAEFKIGQGFLVVSNIRPDDASAVIGGNERVIRPRLADAKFFFDQDRKRPLSSRVEGLAKVVYHNKLGTQGERMQRVRQLAQGIGRRWEGELLARKADQAAQLSKADLLTDMVGEFPELQGTMGRYYAQADGLPQDIADAIEDHYKPRFAGDTLPRGPVGVVAALADKLETLAGLFAIGQLPTGDKDPFALRRHALGIVRMMIEMDLPLALDQLLADAVALFPQAPKDTEALLSDFVFDRLAGSLREQGYSAQEVDAVLALRPQQLGDVAKRLQAVRAFAALPEAPALAAANKRIGNILKKAEGGVVTDVSEPLLREQAEKALYAATRELGPIATRKFESGDYTGSLQTLAGLRGPVDAFFDGVMVNAEEADLRRNRLGLLATLHGAMNRVADLSRLAT